MTYTVESGTILTDRQTDRQTQNYAVLQNHHQTQDVTALWACQLHSCSDIARSSSRLSDLPQETSEDLRELHQGQERTAHTSTESYATEESSLNERCSGIMGVPITYLFKHCPEQFEIVGMCENMDLYGLKTKVYTSEECRKRYFELFGKKGTYDLNAAGVVNGIKVYQRLLIRRISKERKQ